LVPGAAHSDDLFYYFKTILTPEIKASSIESKLINTMVELITNFAYNRPPVDGIWKPVNKSDEVPSVLNIGNDGQSMIPLPEHSNLKVFDDIYKEANVDLI
jgi:carboxylesterase type B